MNDTPRTDVEVESHQFESYSNQISYMTSLARQLERELAAAKSELEQFKKREREFPTHHSQALSPELRTW